MKEKENVVKWQKVEFGGVEYRSLKMACRTLDIPYMTVWKRINRDGWALERALSTAVGYAKSFEYNGTQYKTIAQAAQTLKISESTIRSRMKDGLTIEQALFAGNDSIVRFDGVEYKNLKVACRELGLTYMGVRRRLERGWTLHDALSTPMRNS